MAGMDACIFCPELFLEGEQVTTLKQKGLDGILKANATSKNKIFPSVGDKVKINTNVSSTHNLQLFLFNIVPRAMP